MARVLSSAALAAAAALALSGCGASSPTAAPTDTASAVWVLPPAPSTAEESPTTTVPAPPPSPTSGSDSGPYSLPQPAVVPGEPPAPAPSVQGRPLPALPPPVQTPAAQATPTRRCAAPGALTATLTAVRMGPGGLVFTIRFENTSGTPQDLTGTTVSVHDNVTMYAQAAHALATGPGAVPAHGSADADYGYLPGSAAQETSLGQPVSKWTANPSQAGFDAYPCPAPAGVENWVSEP